MFLQRRVAETEGWQDGVGSPLSLVPLGKARNLK